MQVSLRLKLAELINTTQAMISKVENADYDEDYFKLLLKVCFIFRKRVDVGGPGVPLIHKPDDCAVLIPA